MTFIRTVCGDITPDLLGRTALHEHLIGKPLLAGEDPDFILDSEAAAIKELRFFTEAGGRAVVEMSPADYGRDVLALRRISEASDVHIITVAGYIKGKSADPFVRELTVTQIADSLIRDICEGIDGTGIKAGILKAGTSLNQITPNEEKIIAAVAIAQRETGAPVSTHTEAGTMALEQVERFTALGVPVERLLIGHLDRNLNWELHLALANTGVTFGYDQFGKEKYAPDFQRIEFVVRMVQAGFRDQLALSMDIARRTYFTSYGGGPGYTYLWWRIVPWLKESGLTDDDIEAIFVRTPARLLAIDR
ncbi:MAG: phosphotriesterase-related protein [Anaerolineae bacterium]|nr:phosphotriesterase-related protein [Anaerolineae bacterium]